MGSQASRAEHRGRRDSRGLSRAPGERWTRFAARIADAFGLVLLLVVATYVLASLVTYSGWGAVALAVVTATCATVGLASAGARAPLPRLSAVIGAVAVLLAVISVAAGSTTTSGISALLQ